MRHSLQTPRTGPSKAGTAAEPGQLAASAAAWAIAFVVTALVAVSFQMEGVFNAGVRSYAWRAGSLILAAALLVSAKFNLRTAREFLSIFGPWLLAIMLLVVLQLGSVPILEDFARQLYMVSIGVCAYVGSQRHFGRSVIRCTMFLLMIYLILSCISPGLQLLSSGWSWDRARIFKTIALHSGTNLNTNFIAIALLVIGLWSERHRIPLLWPIGAATLFVGSIFFATRAPLASAAIAAVVTAGYVALQERRGPTAPQPRLLPLAILVVPLAVIIWITLHPMAFVTQELSLRTYLWQMALKVWQAHPLMGGGEDPLSVGKGIAINVPVFKLDWEREAVTGIAYGGFHNQWMEVLASKGLIGFAGLLASFYLLLRHAMIGSRTPGGAALLSLVLVLLMRSFVELQAPFSYQNSALDFLAMVLLAWCAAQSRNHTSDFTVQGLDASRRYLQRRSLVRGVLRPEGTP